MLVKGEPSDSSVQVELYTIDSRYIAVEYNTMSHRDQQPQS